MAKLTAFIGRNRNLNIFNFECDCGTFAEIGLPAKDVKIFQCVDCGKAYVHIPKSETALYQQPRIVEMSVRRQA